MYVLQVHVPGNGQPYTLSGATEYAGGKFLANYIPAHSLLPGNKTLVPLTLENTKNLAPNISSIAYMSPNIYWSNMFDG